MKSNSFVFMIAVILLSICFTACGESNKTTPSNNIENTVDRVWTEWVDKCCVYIVRFVIVGNCLFENVCTVS